MPQEIRVVKCFNCHIYQADIVKKAKQWQCKRCNEKQSVLVEFGRGTGTYCRKLSQTLNEKQGEIELDQFNQCRESIEQFESNSSDQSDDDKIEINNENISNCNSKWSEITKLYEDEEYDNIDKNEILDTCETSKFTSNDNSNSTTNFSTKLFSKNKNCNDSFKINRAENLINFSLKGKWSQTSKPLEKTEINDIVVTQENLFTLNPKTISTESELPESSENSTFKDNKYKQLEQNEYNKDNENDFISNQNEFCEFRRSIKRKSFSRDDSKLEKICKYDNKIDNIDLDVEEFDNIIEDQSSESSPNLNFDIETRSQNNTYSFINDTCIQQKKKLENNDHFSESILFPQNEENTKWSKYLPETEEEEDILF